jgi:hypothetical protein
MTSRQPFVFLTGVATGLFLMAFCRLPSREAVAQEGKLPFASSIDQRQQTVEELRKLNSLVQKQIDLMTSGKMRVVVVGKAE